MLRTKFTTNESFLSSTNVIEFQVICYIVSFISMRQIMRYIIKIEKLRFFNRIIIKNINNSIKAFF